MVVNLSIHFFMGMLRLKIRSSISQPSKEVRYLNFGLSNICRLMFFNKAIMKKTFLLEGLSI